MSSYPLNILNACIRLLLSLLVSSVVNPIFKNLVSYFYSEKPFWLPFFILSKIFIFFKYGFHAYLQYFSFGLMNDL